VTTDLTGAAEAERRYPALNPDADELTYPRSALRDFERAAFIEGVGFAREQIAREIEDHADKLPNDYGTHWISGDTAARIARGERP